MLVDELDLLPLAELLFDLELLLDELELRGDVLWEGDLELELLGDILLLLVDFDTYFDEDRDDLPSRRFISSLTSFITFSFGIGNMLLLF